MYASRRKAELVDAQTFSFLNYEEFVIRRCSIRRLTL